MFASRNENLEIKKSILDETLITLQRGVKRMSVRLLSEQKFSPLSETKTKIHDRRVLNNKYHVLLLVKILPENNFEFGVNLSAESTKQDAKRVCVRVSGCRKCRMHTIWKK